MRKQVQAVLKYIDGRKEARLVEPGTYRIRERDVSEIQALESYKKFVAGDRHDFALVETTERDGEAVLVFQEEA